MNNGSLGWVFALKGQKRIVQGRAKFARAMPWREDVCDNKRNPIKANSIEPTDTLQYQS